MDYIRKKRGVTYYSEACKMYLRHDFKHTCAYCGAIEEAQYVNPVVADSGFQKDHFIPQKRTDSLLQEDIELHAYSNLFYACSKCNRLKDNVLLPLNPCEVHIFFGDNPCIKVGTESTGFVMTSDLPEGQDFIRKLDLNSRYHLETRKAQNEWLKTTLEAKEVLHNLKSSGKIDQKLLDILEKEMNLGKTDEYLNTCGGSKYGLSIAAVCNCLNEKGYATELVFEENELDVKVIIGGTTYLAKISPLNGASQCRVKTADLAEWKKFDMPCGILRFQESPMRIRFYQIDFDNVSWEKTEYRIDKYCEL